MCLTEIECFGKSGFLIFLFLFRFTKYACYVCHVSGMFDHLLKDILACLLFLCIPRERNRTCTSKNLLNSVPDCNEGKAKEDSKCATNLSKKRGGWKDEHLGKYILI